VARSSSDLSVDPLDGRGHELTEEAAADIRTVAKGGAIQVTGQISQRSVSFFFTAVAVRVLEAGGYGLFRLVAQVLAVAGQLGLLGFNYAAMRFIARARARGDHPAVRGAARVAVTGAAATSVVVMAVLIALAGPLSASFADSAGQRDELARLVRIGAAYIPFFALMQVLRYCTQAYKTMVPSVVVGNVIQPVARFVLGVSALLIGVSVAASQQWLVESAVVTLVASMGVGALAGAVVYARVLTPEERRAKPRSEPGAMLRFALPQMGASLLGIQSLGIGVLLLGWLSVDREVGLFGVALALQGPAGVFLSGIVNIWAPVVTDLYERGAIDTLDSLYKTITRWVATFSLPVLGLLLLEPDLLVRLFATSRLADAAPVVALLAVGNIFYTGTGPTGYVLSMTGRPGVNFANSAVAVVLYAVGGMVVVPRHGAVGMAAVDAAVTALVNSARILEARLLVGVQPFGRSFLKPVGATLVAAVVLLAWRLVGGGTAVQILGVVVAAAVYLGVLRVLGLDAEERYVWERIRARALRWRAGRR
jgi:O-antigen/teichoic acid export membrane protein